MNKQITNIVFTKNRPLQFEGYLESLYRHFPQELFQTYVLYKPELFNEQYQQLFQKFSNCQVIEEKDFSKDFFSILNETNTQYMLFGVDDVVYFDSVDFDLIDGTFKQFPKDIFGFSLRFSEQSINKSDPVREANIASQPVYSINWSQGRTPTTRYPFELCCTIYETALVKKIISSTINNNPLIKKLFSPSSVLIKILGKSKLRRSILKSFGYFFSPNTLESWNCRWCQHNSDKLPSSIYFQKNCACAVQVNMVNTTTKESFGGHENLTVETLNEKYKQGHRFDIEFVANNKPAETHCGSESFKLRKYEG